MKKKMMALSLAVLLIVVAAIGGTMAYFTDNESATNTFTMGNVDITLTETEWHAPVNVAPGISYAKNPVVTNTGMNPAWIRVDVTLSDAAAFKAAAARHNITDLDTIFDGHSEDKWTRAAIEDDTTNGTLTYSYYYKNLLPAGTSTSALFTAVEIPAAFNNADMAAIGADFTITIEAHAIQDADGFVNVEKAFEKYIAE